MIVDKLGYKQLSAAGQIKAGPAGLFSVTCVVAGSIVIYDNPTAASGNILFTKTMTLGEIANWGGPGISANAGLWAVPAGGGKFNVAYT